MSDFEKAVSEYQKLGPIKSEGDTPENFHRVELLKSLDEFANEKPVSELLLSIISSDAEYDLAKCEALKIFEIYLDEDNLMFPQFRDAIKRLLSDPNEDEMILQYAEAAIEDYLE